jgi:hypothetical protein
MIKPVNRIACAYALSQQACLIPTMDLDAFVKGI